MWTCRNCGEELEDTFDACWKCKRRRDGVSEEAPAADPVPPALRCTRCDRALEYAGTKSLHEGTNWGFLGELGEFFVKRESLDFYVCPRCGRVELYVDGIGEDLRPR